MNSSPRRRCPLHLASLLFRSIARRLCRLARGPLHTQLPLLFVKLSRAARKGALQLARSSLRHLQRLLKRRIGLAAARRSRARVATTDTSKCAELSARRCRGVTCDDLLSCGSSLSCQGTVLLLQLAELSDCARLCLVPFGGLCRMPTCLLGLRGLRDSQCF